MQSAVINTAKLPGVSISSLDHWSFGSQPLRLVGEGAFRVAAELISEVHNKTEVDVFVARPSPQWLSGRRQSRWRRIRHTNATVAAVSPTSGPGPAPDGSLRVLLVITDAHRWRIDTHAGPSLSSKVAALLDDHIGAMITAATEVGIVVVDPLDRLDVEPSPMSFLLADAPYLVCDRPAELTTPTPFRKGTTETPMPRWRLAG